MRWRAYSIYDDYTSMYRLTDAGQVAAAAVELSAEDALRKVLKSAWPRDLLGYGLCQIVSHVTVCDPIRS